MYNKNTGWQPSAFFIAFLCTFYLRNTTVGTRKKSVLILWILLISSLTFGIYKNFTAIDQHTIHETEIIETELVDTNAIESFTRQFVDVYHVWDNVTDALGARAVELSEYMTDDLLSLNTEMISEDISTEVSVTGMDMWSVTEVSEGNFSVVYTVRQKITEDDDETWNRATYQIMIHQDEAENLVVTQNPTVWHEPEKSDYTPESPENNNTVESEIVDEVTSFLETFFASYPTATEAELSYYVEEDVLPPINENYTFSELMNPIFQAEGEQINVWVTVKYTDHTTQANQLSQYVLTLEKENNWRIVE